MPQSRPMVVTLRMSAFGQKQTFNHAQKTPHWAGLFLNPVLVQTFFRRLANPIPARPMPRSARVPGSGTEVTLCANITTVVPPIVFQAFTLAGVRPTVPPV